MLSVKNEMKCLFLCVLKPISIGLFEFVVVVSLYHNLLFLH